MNNQNSLSAYFDESNKRTFKSHKARLIRELSKNPGQHTHQLALKLRLSNEQVNKRLSESANSDIFETCGNTTYFGNPIALYKLKDQLSMFPVEKKLSLRKWIEKNHPSIIFEYEALINHSI